MSMEAQCRDEVVSLHQFFEDWFNGRLPATEEAFAHVRRSLAPGFQLVSPRAAVDERDALFASLWGAHGKMPGFRIWIEDYAFKQVPGHDDLAVVMYKEWQENGGGARTCRISSALFAADASGPHGVVWLHLHETWVQLSASAPA